MKRNVMYMIDTGVNEMKKVAAYVRVSTDEQREYSPESQLKMIQEYAKRNDMIIPAEYIYEDEGISGTSTRMRKDFNRMIAEAKKEPKPFEAILVWKFSRFARNREDSVVLKGMLRKELGIEVISVSENIGDDKTSILIEALIEAMDEYYSVNLSDEVRRGMKEKVSRGEAVSVASFGYRMESKEYKINEEEAEFVRFMYKEFLKGKGFKEIAEELNRLGVRTHRGNEFEGRAVKYILGNPVYIGKIRWNTESRSDRKFDKQGVVITEGKHERILDNETWEAAQRKLKGYESHNISKDSGEIYMLKGLVKCSNCGSNLVKSNGANRLQCSGYAHGKCKISHSVNMKEIESAVILSVKALLKDRLIELKSRDSENKDRIRLINGSIHREEGKLNRIKEAFEEGAYSLDEYKNSKSRIQVQIRKLEEERMKILKEGKKQEAIQPQTIDLILLNRNITNRVKNNILQLLIEKIIFNRKSNEINVIFKNLDGN